MKTFSTPFGFRWMIALLISGASVLAQTGPIRLDVDATDAPRKILHAHLNIPAQPGPLTLLYPKWIPGEHAPDGPITDLTGLKFSAAGQTIPWRRDGEDMFAFHLDVPAGATAVEVSLDFLLPPNSGEFSSGASATPQLLDLSWNQVLLYPKGTRVSEIQYAATLRLPPAWKFGTALRVASQSGTTLEFAPVTLETLVDSPVITGNHFKTIDLTPGNSTPQLLHLVADSEAALEIRPEDTRHFAHLVGEANALFGAHHYGSYHFLLTLSDHVAHFGLEHHESSDDRMGEKYLTDEDLRKVGADLLPHEMTHSWNGKHRRPAGLATSDYQQPMNDELLWVYEGLTEYLGDILAVRCGLWTNQDFRERFALIAAKLDLRPGRTWRPLADTTMAAQLLYFARTEGTAWRREVDFYEEGELIWLEADVIIRQQSQGRRTLDDFCKKFHGGESGGPKVIPYSYADVVAALNEIAPHDWKAFFDERVYSVTPRAPLGGIEGAGWRLAYTNGISSMLKSQESYRKATDLGCSVGLLIKEDGYINDVIPGSPADKAGIGAAMKLDAVNGRKWSPEIFRDAIKSAKTNTAPIELLVENEDYYKTCRVDYHEGEKYPILERDASKPDLLSEILKALTPEPRL